MESRVSQGWAIPITLSGSLSQSSPKEGAALGHAASQLSPKLPGRGTFLGPWCCALYTPSSSARERLHTDRQKAFPHKIQQPKLNFCCSALFYLFTVLFHRYSSVKLTAVFHLCFVLTTIIPMNSIYTSWVERFYIILISVLGPASEKNLTQAQGPNFLWW